MWEIIVTAFVLDGLLILGASRYFRFHPIQPGDPIRRVTLFGRFFPGMTLVLNSFTILPEILKNRPAYTSRLEKPREYLFSVYLHHLPFSLVLILSILPPLAIFFFRWLQLPEPQAFGILWGQLPPFISNLAYGDYFLVVLGSAAALLVLTVFLRTDAGLNLFSKTGPIPALGLEPPPANAARRKAGQALFLLAALYFVFLAGRAALAHTLPGEDLLLCLVLLLSGAILQEVDPQTVAQWLKPRLWPGLSMLLAHASLVLLLVQWSSIEKVRWWAALLFIASVLNLLRFHVRIPTIFWIVNFAMALFSIHLIAWWNAYVGDEYTFFYSANEILQKYNLHGVLSHLFNGTYVYGTHPYFSSVIQAIFMKLLGADSIGWRFSNVYLSAISIFFFYDFLKRFLSNRLAIIAASMLACSQYLIGFSKIGYNNLQAFFVLCLVLWAAGWAAQSKRPLAFTVLGLSLAACFYVFPVALYAIPLGIFIPLFFGTFPRRSNAHLWLHLAVAFAMPVFPLLLQPDYWAAKIPGIFLPGIDQPSSGIQALLAHLVPNSVYALFSFAYRITPGHFVAVSYMDMISCGLIFLGLAAMLSQVFRQRFAAFWMLTFAYMVVGVGATHQYDFPPSSRMFMLLPWFCLLAASGLEWVLGKASKIGWIRRARAAVTVFCLMIVLAANLLQALTIGVSEAKASATTEDLFMRIAESSATLDPSDSRTYVFLVAPGMGIDNMKLVQSAYHRPRSQAQMVQFIQDSPQLSPQILALLKDPKTVVIFRRGMDPRLQDAAERVIRQTGRISCQVSGDIDSYPFLILWFTPGQDSLCW